MLQKILSLQQFDKGRPESVGMKFTTAVQEQCYTKIKPWLGALCVAEPLVEHEDQPIFVLPLGSAAAVVEILPWGESEAVITTRAYVAINVELTPELMRLLLLQNGQMSFGAFSIDDAGDIRFEHSIVGSTCDEVELTTSVRAVLETADTFDDKITAHWGGQRSIDHAS